MAMKEQRPSSETPAWRSGDRPEFHDDRRENSRKQTKNDNFWTPIRP